MGITNRSQGVVLRLKRSKLKINASLSAICSGLDLLPVKVLSEFTEISKKASTEKFFVNLLKNQDGSFKVDLLPSPDSEELRKLIRGSKDQKRVLEGIRLYAESTPDKSLSGSVENRYKELLGHYRSFKR